MPPHPVSASSQYGLWRTAAAVALGATALLLVALVRWPEIALTILWDMVIPLVPASLLVSPSLWRNVCPLATLNTVTNGVRTRRLLHARTSAGAGAVGIALLLLLVPARRFLFNVDGPALAVTIAAVGALALTLGAFFDLKAGFCNALCPVLPVERLYGQRPLLALSNWRCRPCTLCTQVGCLDLAPTKSMAQILGPSRRSRAWLFTPYGAFAAAFPGFIVGYYTTADGALVTALAVYTHVALWMVASYALVWVVAGATKLSAARLVPGLAATAAGVYYWYAAPIMAEALSVATVGTLSIRVAALALVAVWLTRRPVA
jgi:hypothetical protein